MFYSINFMVTLDKCCVHHISTIPSYISNGAAIFSFSTSSWLISNHSDRTESTCSPNNGAGTGRCASPTFQAKQASYIHPFWMLYVLKYSTLVQIFIIIQFRHIQHCSTRNTAFANQLHGFTLCILFCELS